MQLPPNPHLQYPQQQWNPQQPPSPPPPAPNKLKKLLRNKWFWIALVGIIVLISDISLLANGSQSNSTPTPASTQQAIQAKDIATTAMAKSTPTPKLDQRIQDLVSGADIVGSISKIQQDSQLVTISENAATNLTHGLIVGGINMDRFDMQKARWTDPTVGKQIPGVVIKLLHTHARPGWQSKHWGRLPPRSPERHRAAFQLK